MSPETCTCTPDSLTLVRRTLHGRRLAPLPHRGLGRIARFGPCRNIFACPETAPGSAAKTLLTPSRVWSAMWSTRSFPSQDGGDPPTLLGFASRARLRTSSRPCHIDTHRDRLHRLPPRTPLRRHPLGSFHPARAMIGDAALTAVLALLVLRSTRRQECDRHREEGNEARRAEGADLRPEPPACRRAQGGWMRGGRPRCGCSGGRAGRSRRGLTPMSPWR